MSLLDLRRKPVSILQDLVKAVLLVAVFLASTSSMIYFAMHEPAVQVPNLLGKRLEEAETEARGAGLKLEVKNRVFDERNPENTVVEQWPRAGTAIKKGQALRVNTSQGPRVARGGKAGEK
ncbi:MAG: PASTA domain-containing protein [Acidobacteria bacterium]|nr:PASTA domain-containing protein [Acidobacteriota bacterium]